MAEVHIGEETSHTSSLYFRPHIRIGSKKTVDNIPLQHRHCKKEHMTKDKVQVTRHEMFPPYIGGSSEVSVIKPQLKRQARGFSMPVDNFRLFEESFKLPVTRLA